MRKKSCNSNVVPVDGSASPVSLGPIYNSGYPEYDAVVESVNLAGDDIKRSRDIIRDRMITAVTAMLVEYPGSEMVLAEALEGARQKIMNDVQARWILRRAIRVNG